MRRNIDTTIELEHATRADRTHTEIFAENVTKFCGSIRFLWAHLVTLGVWILWNMLPQLKQ